MATDSARLARAVAYLSRRLRQERQSDLTATQLAVLGSVKMLGAATPSQIASRERVTQPSVTRTLNHLLDRGLVTKQADPDDGRQVVIAVSEKGRTMLAHERQRRDAWLEERLAELSPQDRAAVIAVIPVLFELAESGE